MKLIVITHYYAYDIEFIDDYTGISIYTDKDMSTPIKTYEDACHDRGREKAQGFIDALEYFEMIDSVEHIQKADYEG